MCVTRYIFYSLFCMKPANAFMNQGKYCTALTHSLISIHVIDVHIYNFTLHTFIHSLTNSFIHFLFL